MKRGQTDLCLIVGVDKQSGMTSHDVVNRVRKIFGERRVGHTGTLDPLASGVLPICIGPATRLDAFLTGHEKSYVVSVVFGAGTDTDDSEGAVVRTGEPPEEVLDPFFATSFVKNLVGKSRQMPPAYSALKVDGVKACDAARRGRCIELKPRDIEIYDASLIGIGGIDGNEPVRWDISVTVSKGTYIRALARDIGGALGCPAHVGALRRTQAGRISLKDCVTLDTLEQIGQSAALDPVDALGLRFCFLDALSASRVGNGSPLIAEGLQVCERRFERTHDGCACTSGVCDSALPLYEGEVVSLVFENKLMALYEYRGEENRLVPCCVFQTGVVRGSCDL